MTRATDEWTDVVHNGILSAEMSLFGAMITGDGPTLPSTVSFVRRDSGAFETIEMIDSVADGWLGFAGTANDFL